MKALTLYQPWATMVAIRAKKIETRSWGTKHRGTLAIHAGLNTRFINWRSKDYCCNIEPFITLLTHFAKQNIWGYTMGACPRGVIIAICELRDCKQIRKFGPGNVCFLTDGTCWVITEREKALGDYREGRFMWFLSDSQIISEPIPAKGHQRLWDWNNG